MGCELEVECPKCGLKKTLRIGIGRAGPEYFRDSILNGEYGDGPKVLLEEHPDWDYLIYDELFGCSCNYLTSFPLIKFHSSDGKDIVFDRYICPKCGKILKADFWGESKCWECGSKLLFCENSRD